MTVSFRRGLLVVLTALVPVGADACCLLNPFDSCGVCGPRPWVGFTVGLPLPRLCGGCGPCGPPPCGPICPPPSPCGCAPLPQPGPILGPAIPSASHCAPAPVCTTLQPRQVTTFQSVPTVQYRREAYVENVPVTTYQQVTIPRTVYQPQTRYRDVAYTVNQQVAQTHTEYVPQPVISHATPLPVASAPCPTCPSGTTYGYTPPATAAFFAPAYPAATYGGSSARVPTPIALPPSSGTNPSQAATLQPPQPYAESAWQTVPQRQAQDSTNIQQMGGFLPSYSPPPAQASRSMFQPAPSAASVWQSRWVR